MERSIWSPACFNSDPRRLTLGARQSHVVPADIMKPCLALPIGVCNHRGCAGAPPCYRGKFGGFGGSPGLPFPLHTLPREAGAAGAAAIPVFDFHLLTSNLHRKFPDRAPAFTCPCCAPAGREIFQTRLF